MTPKELLEYAVIGDFLSDVVPPADIRELARRHGVCTEDFGNPDLAKVFAIAMGYAGNTNETLLGELHAKGVSQFLCEEAIRHSAATMMDCEMNLCNLRNNTINTQINKLIADAGKYASDGVSRAYATIDVLKTYIDRTEARKKTTGGVQSAWEFFNDNGNDTCEANRLFADEQDDWLSKEGCAVLVSTTGTGKSVLSMQMALFWAGGKTCFGITPVHPLKVAIIQTEDSAKIVKRNLTSFRKACGWTDDEFRQAMENVSLVDIKGKTGEAFIDLLANVQRDGGYDLIVINPLQGVLGGLDIKSNAELSRFLRDGLDSILKGRRMNCPKCALLLVHHTNKPIQQAHGGPGVGSSQFLEYSCAGGAEISNWMRSLLVMLEQTGKNSKPGHFNLIGAKNGSWLGWPERFDNRPVWRIRRHDPEFDGGGNLVYWYDADSQSAALPEQEKTKGPTDADVRRLADEIKSLKRPPTMTEVRDLAAKIFGRTLGRAIYALIKADWNKYGLEVITGDSLAEKLVVPIKKH